MSYALRACSFGVRANNLQPREKRLIIVFSTVDTAEQGVCLAECIEASADDYANGAEVMTRLCRDLNPISTLFISRAEGSRRSWVRDCFDAHFNFYNPSVAALPCHLPLHKGGYFAVL